MKSSFQDLSLEVTPDNVGVLTLKRAEHHNTLSESLKTELRQVFQNLSQSTALSALVITGEGRSFCSGGDLKHLQQTTRTPDEDRRRIYQLHEWVQPLLNLEIPVIAAVNGAAIGAGFGLAIAADFVLCSSHAYFRASFCRVGLVPDTGLFFTLPRIVGLQTAKELIFTGRKVSAAQARELRIAYAVHPPEDLLNEALKLAKRLSRGPTSAIGASKRILNQSFHLDSRALVEMEAAAQAIFFHSPYHQKAIDDFANGRPFAFDWEQTTDV